MTFQEITVGAMFSYNGATFKKKSSRTAFIYGQPNRWFYFGKKDQVKLIKTS